MTDTPKPEPLTYDDLFVRLACMTIKANDQLIAERDALAARVKELESIIAGLRLTRWRMTDLIAEARAFLAGGTDGP